MKLTGLQVLTIAQNAGRETVARAGRMLSLFTSQQATFKINDERVRDKIKTILRTNGSVSLTHKIDDKLTRSFIRSDQHASRKLDSAISKYQPSLDHLSLFIDSSKYPLSKEKLAKILYPALSVLPTEIEASEKLARIGRMFLEAQCQAYMMQLPSRNMPEIVSGYDFSRYEDGSCEALYDPVQLTRFLQANGLFESVILDFNSHERQREDQAISTLYRLVGTILQSYGFRKTSEFLRDRVIDGTNGLMRFRIDR